MEMMFDHGYNVTAYHHTYMISAKQKTQQPQSRIAFEAVVLLILRAVSDSPDSARPPQTQRSSESNSVPFGASA